MGLRIPAPRWTTQGPTKLATFAQLAAARSTEGGEVGEEVGGQEEDREAGRRQVRGRRQKEGGKLEAGGKYGSRRTLFKNEGPTQEDIDKKWNKDGKLQDIFSLPAHTSLQSRMPNVLPLKANTCPQTQPCRIIPGSSYNRSSRQWCALCVFLICIMSGAMS